MEYSRPRMILLLTMMARDSLVNEAAVVHSHINSQGLERIIFQADILIMVNFWI